MEAATATRDDAAPARPESRHGTLQLGLYVDAGLRDLAQEVCADLGKDLDSRYDEVTWEVNLTERDGDAAAGQTGELIAGARRRMLAKGLGPGHLLDEAAVALSTGGRWSR